MASYSHDRNSVDDLTFELLKAMPKNLPLHQQLGEDFLRLLVEQQPNATLQQYCQTVQQQRGICLSQQTMCKLLARIGLSGHERRQVATAPAKALAA
jgi:transposase